MRELVNPNIDYGYLRSTNDCARVLSITTGKVSTDPSGDCDFVFSVDKEAFYSTQELNSIGASKLIIMVQVVLDEDSTKIFRKNLDQLSSYLDIIKFEVHQKILDTRVGSISIPNFEVANVWCGIVTSDQDLDTLVKRDLYLMLSEKSHTFPFGHDLEKYYIELNKDN